MLLQVPLVCLILMEKEHLYIIAVLHLEIMTFAITLIYFEKWQRRGIFNPFIEELENDLLTLIFKSLENSI